MTLLVARLFLTHKIENLTAITNNMIEYTHNLYIKHLKVQVNELNCQMKTGSTPNIFGEPSIQTKDPLQI